MPRPRRRPQNQVAQIRRTLRRAGDPQWRYAKDLAAASRISGRPWQLIAAIAQAESSGGRYVPKNAPFNFWGWSVNTGQQHSNITNPFQNPHTAYRYYARGLRRGYSGGNSIYDPVWEKYAASPAWQGNVASFLKKYGVNPNAIGKPNVGPGMGGGGGRPVRGGGRAGVSPEMQKLRKFFLTQYAAGTSATELLPFIMMAKSQMKPGKPFARGRDQNGQGVTFEAGPGVRVGARERKVVNLAKQYLGTPYVWGGERPGGFDCSGLLQYVYAKIGVKIPRVTYDQVKAGRGVKRSQLQPGDAVFFGSRNNVHHVGMYIGNGKFIEAPFTGARVRISLLSGRKDFVTARRYV